ncbi:hypothetical protein [uncultured Clostridium sp.]|uniref:hypothetical protein n=1 Tax=uncultured Clostridium sp. TaxID=59620 RepID=UPI0025F6A087|nr:hypothetical protein [uncultured Clostridium sp.]MDU2289144.1 hypothetical protein [Clostridium celatum]MDU4325900.1 hypothetical protein [Clostridium celatum]
MGIKKMQGVAAHIEYIKKDYDNVDFINCKFWKNEICYNTLSTKYGEACYTKRGCMYSIPLPPGSKKKVKIEDKHKGERLNTPTITYTYKISDIKRDYFNKDITTTVKVEHRPYKVEFKYNSKGDKHLLVIYYKANGKTHAINCDLDLSKVIRISGNEVIFTVKIDDIVSSMRNIKEERIADFIKSENKSNIIRKAIVSDSKDVINKIDSLIKFTAYVIIKGFMEIY